MKGLRQLGAFIVIVGIPVIFFWANAESVIPPYNEWQVPGIVAVSTLWACAWTYALNEAWFK